MKWKTACCSSGSVWSLEENKIFENALAVFDEDTADRWEKVAAMVPGKNPFEIRRHYQDLVEDVNVIDAGRVGIPCYAPSSYTPQWVREQLDGFRASQKLFAASDHGVCQSSAGRGLSVKPAEQERKKGVPWSQEEHRLFLMGLRKYGKGDWKSISRNFVVSRTPTQVASHAQKYFIRLNSGSKDKRRSSIHDITSINGTDMWQPSVKQTSAMTAQTGFSSITRASGQSPGLMYSTSPTGGPPMTNPVELSESGNPVMPLPHSSGTHDQKALGGRSPTPIIRAFL